MGIFDTWIEDIPQQFQGKPYIEALILAFSRQLDELYQVFNQLDSETDLESAVGKNLDMVGDIVALTRKEAGILLGIGVTEPVISDERYRQFLRYKCLVNTCECTYYDIMKSIELIWHTDNMRYREDPKRPARIIIDLKEMEVDLGIDPAIGKIMIVKPAGVALMYTTSYIIVIDSRRLEKFKLQNIDMHIKIDFFNVYVYNGTIRYNGSAHYNAKRGYKLGTRLVLHSGAEGPKEGICDLSVETRRNVQYYNGGKTYNGLTKYNAMIRRDEIK